MVVPGQLKVPRMRAQVQATIELIRPALHADGGDIVLREVDEATGIVSVTLLGACGTCPSSTVTLKAGVERILRDRVHGVTEVVNVVDDVADDTPHDHAAGPAGHTAA
jgi:Fe-S cluster biogenesis protein NfuA